MVSKRGMRGIDGLLARQFTERILHRVAHGSTDHRAASVSRLSYLQWFPVSYLLCIHVVTDGREKT